MSRVCFVLTHLLFFTGIFVRSLSIHCILYVWWQYVLDWRITGHTRNSLKTYAILWARATCWKSRCVAHALPLLIKKKNFAKGESLLICSRSSSVHATSGLSSCNLAINTYIYPFLWIAWPTIDATCIVVITTAHTSLRMFCHQRVWGFHPSRRTATFADSSKMRENPWQVTTNLPSFFYFWLSETLIVMYHQAIGVSKKVSVHDVSQFSDHLEGIYECQHVPFEPTHALMKFTSTLHVGAK